MSGQLELFPPPLAALPPRFKLAQDIKELILRQELAEDGPVRYDDDGQPHIVWDEVRISAVVAGPHRAAEATFVWRQRPVATMRVDNVDFGAGQTLHITNIFGTTPLTIT